jgi:hypothetical protein
MGSGVSPRTFSSEKPSNPAMGQDLRFTLGFPSDPDAHDDHAQSVAQTYVCISQISGPH